MANKSYHWKNNLSNGGNGVARIEAQSDKITMQYTEPDLEGSMDGIIYTKWILDSSIKAPSAPDACDGTFAATLTPLGRFGRRYASIEGLSVAECDNLARALGKE